MSDPKAEIIAVGTELLLGQISNTNAQWISQQLADHGIDVHFHEVVGDNLLRVKETFEQAANRSEIIIITGGLGPTEDDLTREAFQLISGMKMVEHAESMDKIEEHFRRQGSMMTPNNRRQARVFDGATVLFNKVGMAPGMIVAYQENIWVFMPGVPREMKAMFSGKVIPYLREKFDTKDIIRSLVLKFSGIGESRLEHELIDLIQSQSNPTIAPLAQDTGVIIRLTAKEKTAEKAGKLLEQTKHQILKRVGSYYIGDEAASIQEQIVLLLQQNNYHIAAAESLTGGLFAEMLTAVPGVSTVFRGSIVSYDPIVKQEVLKVSGKTIRQYGTVSEACASEMAENAKRLMHADIAVSFTGVAGPDSLEGRPAGNVFIGIATAENTIEVEECQFSGERAEIRKQSVIKALKLLLKYLNK